MAINAGTNQLFQLGQQFSSSPVERAAGQLEAQRLAAEREAERIRTEQEQAAFRSEAERLTQERQAAQEATRNLVASTALQRLQTNDYGLDWQTQMMDQLKYGGNIAPQLSGGGANMNDLFGLYESGSIFGEYPTSGQMPVGMAQIYPLLGMGTSSEAAANIEEKNRLVRDVRGRFTPLYYNASTEGYTPPSGVAGPGGVLFNSGLGKTNENPGDYATPGAGLWAAGFDPNDPLVLQKVYDYFSVNRGPVWDKYKPERNASGAWVKGNADQALEFLTEADHWLRQEATKMDLPKRGIMDSMVGNLIVGGLVSAFTGGLGTIISGLSGSAAIGNVASALASAGIGGATGGLQGAITGGLGSAIGSGIDFAGGIGEFIRNPLDALGGAFDFGANAAGGAAGGLLGMADAAQVGPGSLASNTPPVTGPIADEIVTVTASPVAGGAASSYGWLPSTLARHGIPLGSQLFVGDNGGIANWTNPDGLLTIRIGPEIPPDFINGQPTGNAVGGTGQGGTPETGGGTGGEAQTGGGTGGASAIGGTVTDLLGGGTGTSVIGSGTTGTGLAGGTTDLAGVGGSGTTGAGIGSSGAGAGGTSGAGGATGDSGSLLDPNVTPGGGGAGVSTGTTTGTGQTLTPEEQALLSAALAAGFSNVQDYINFQFSSTTPGTGSGTTGTGMTTGTPGAGYTPGGVTGGGFETGTGTGTTTGAGPGAGTGTGTGTAPSNESGLTDAELIALLTGGATGVVPGTTTGQGGFSTTTGDTANVFTSTGPGTGPGPGPGTGPGDGTGDGSGTGSGLDQFSSQLQGLLQTGFQPGTGADFMDPFSVGSLIKPGQTQMPKTPARKKKGIRVNISGRYRNA